MEINLKLKIDNFEEYQEKVEKIKKLLNELNNTTLKLEIEEDEIKDIADCANKLKNQD